MPVRPDRLGKANARVASKSTDFDSLLGVSDLDHELHELALLLVDLHDPVFRFQVFLSEVIFELRDLSHFLTVLDELRVLTS